MKRHYQIIVEQDKDGVFIIECPAFAGCRSYGDTMKEALENIKEAIQVCAEELDDEQLDELPSFIGVRDIEIAMI